MAKKNKKVPLDRECLMEALKLRNTSIRRLGSENQLGWSSKSIERGLRDGEVSPELMDSLGHHLDVDTDYLSGKIHRDIEKTKDESFCAILKSELNADKFPYILKQQRIKYDGKFLYEKYLEYVLIIHDISMHQFNEMLFEKQKVFQLDLEEAIARVLMKHFSYNAMGQDIFPEIYKIANDIENYNPDEPEIPDDFMTYDSGVTNRFKDRFADCQLIGGSDNENQK